MCRSEFLRWHVSAVLPDTLWELEANMMSRKGLLVLFLGLSIFSGAMATQESQDHDFKKRDTPTVPAVGTSGMVSSAHPIATQAGLDILAADGNAFDAT